MFLSCFERKNDKVLTINIDFRVFNFQIGASL